MVELLKTSAEGARLVLLQALGHLPEGLHIAMDDAAAASGRGTPDLVEQVSCMDHRAQGDVSSSTRVAAQPACRLPAVTLPYSVEVMAVKNAHVCMVGRWLE